MCRSLSLTYTHGAVVVELGCGQVCRHLAVCAGGADGARTGMEQALEARMTRSRCVQRTGPFWHASEGTSRRTSRRPQAASAWELWPAWGPCALASAEPQNRVCGAQISCDVPHELFVHRMRSLYSMYRVMEDVRAKASQICVCN